MPETLKATVRRIFAQPPCFFEWPADDTLAVSQGSAVLQCKTDHEATLACMMPPNNPQIVRYHTTLLLLLAACAGWKDSDAWFTSAFRAARTESQRFIHRDGGKVFDLTIDKAHMLTTLHITEPA